MRTLLFCTGNHEKFLNAAHAARKYDIKLEQRELTIDEIQSEDAEAIVRDKLQKAYELVRQPVVVTDDSWEIPALNGFPGPYMKSINHWLSPEDYLRLTKPLADRRIFLIQRVGFTDGATTKILTAKTGGTLLTDIKGDYGLANHKLVSMDGDSGLSIAEIYDQGLDNGERAAVKVWHELLEWLTASTR